ncbi:hypothetical protein GCM10027072_06270 [Streptomyces bullii]
MTLSRVSGSGTFTQSGAATTTLTGGAVTYTGTTTVTKGTLALRDGATLVRSRAIRLTTAGARLDTGTAGLRVATTLGGRGTVRGAVTNDGVVAGGLTVDGGYTQSRKGTLVLGGKPLKVTGPVRLAGELDLSAAGRGSRGRPARQITVLDHAGHTRATGTFTGLKEGAPVKLADTTYRIGYRGGDGNDVVLTAVTMPDSSPTPRGTPASGAATPRTTGTAADEGFGWWPYALGLGLLGAMVVPVARRGARAGRGRHAARH